MAAATPASDPKVPKTMTLPQSLLERLDRLAARERRSRSGQVSFMLELAIDSHEARIERTAEEA